MIMSRQLEEPRAVSASFQSFLWKEISQIRDAEKEGDLVSALYLVLSLVKYLPVKIKNKLKEDVERIEEDLRLALNAKTYDFHTTMIVKNKALRRVAEEHLNEFIDKLMAELDLRGIYMEYKGREVEVGFSHTWLKRMAHT